MRTKPLQDLADRVPEVATGGLERARRGGQSLLGSIPRASIAAHLGDGAHRLNDLADRAGVPIPARLEKLGRDGRHSRTSLRGGLLALAAAVALLAVLRTRRARQAGADDAGAESDTAEGDAPAGSSSNHVAKPREGKSADAAVPGNNWH